MEAFAMKVDDLLGRFTTRCPFAVLTQVCIHALAGDELDKVFHEERSRQYEREVAFSAVAMAVADVTLGFAENFNQAYKAHKKNLGVSLNSFYEKIKATELAVSEGLVARSARRSADMQDALGFVPWELLAGYRVFSIDGNHLQESDKRLGPLRDAFDAPLPGTIVARFDHQRQLFDRSYLLEDAHAQESSVSDRIAADLQPKDLLIADRHYCVLAFLQRIDQSRAAFAIRQHGRFKGVLVGTRRKVGRTNTGTVYEQKILTSHHRDAFSMRRITLELDQPTRDGDTEIHILTNLPAEVSALQIADIYALRWEEETGFFYLTTTLTCEVPSVGHPRAALLLFCMALLAFNLRQVIFAALYAEHAEEDVQEVSHHQVSVEVWRYTDGMLAAIDASLWDQWIPSHPQGVAQLLRRIVGSIPLREYRKSKRGPKKKKTTQKPNRPKTHMSTAKALAEAKARRP
jgi:hypothetical protein